MSDSEKHFGPKFFALGLVLGGALIAFFVVLSESQGLRSGFVGVPPNATWYEPDAGGDSGSGGLASGGPASGAAEGH